MRNLFAIALLLPLNGWAADYYFDSTSGANNNAGTSEGAPWRDLSKAYGTSLGADVKFHFKCGETFKVSDIGSGSVGNTIGWPITASGTSGHEITFDSYGTCTGSNKPIIDATETIVGPWSHVSGNVWKVPLLSGSTLLSEGFENSGDPPTGWTKSGAQTITYDTARTGSSGSYSVKMVAGSANPQLYQTIVVTGGRWYKLDAWMKNSGGTSLIGLYWTNGVSQNHTTGFVTNVSWTQHTKYVWIPANVSSVNLFLYGTSNGNTAWFDDVSLTPVIGVNQSYSVFVDGKSTIKAGSQGAVDAYGEWYFDSGAYDLYLYSTTDPSNKTVIVANRQYIFTVTASYLKWDGLEFHGGEYGFYIKQGGNITLSNNKFTYPGYSQFVKFEPTTGQSFSTATVSGNVFDFLYDPLAQRGDSGYGDAIAIRNGSSNVTVSGNSFYDCSHSQVAVETLANGATVNDNNVITGNYHTSPNSNYCRPYGVVGASGATTDTVITKNHIVDVPVRSQICGDRTIVSYNVFSDTRGSTTHSPLYEEYPVQQGEPISVYTWNLASIGDQVCKDMVIANNSIIGGENSGLLTINDLNSDSWSANDLVNNLLVNTGSLFNNRVIWAQGAYLANTTYRYTHIYNSGGTMNVRYGDSGHGVTDYAASAVDALSLSDGNDFSDTALSNPLLSNASGTSIADATPTETSPVIDSGTTVSGLSVDYNGNPFWGTPDRGAIEYQPTRIIGTNALTAPSARIYQGDQEGRFRALAASTGTCAVEITPASGTWNDLSATDVRPAFGDVTNLTCPSKSKTTFTFTPATTHSNPVFRFTGGLKAKQYLVKVDGVNAGSSITGCSASKCTANASGLVTFTWNGDLSAAKSFVIQEYASSNTAPWRSHQADKWRHPND